MKWNALAKTRGEDVKMLPWCLADTEQWQHSRTQWNDFLQGVMEEATPTNWPFV